MLALTRRRRSPRVAIIGAGFGGLAAAVALRSRGIDDLTIIDRCSEHYTGKPYPIRDRGRVAAWIEVDRWHGWGAVKASDVPDNAG